MVDTVYIEEAVQNLERTQQVLLRYPTANKIVIEKYSEIFNPRGQNFRLQKNNPALILAAKKNKKVLSTPSQYETGGGANYYFSHMLNCIYDCRYCFLQGMYRSANYLLFVNYEDFVEEIKDVAKSHENDEKPAWFFSGYDCDSLAYEPVTKFANYFLQAFESIPNAVLELRTKSTQIRSLLERESMSNVVVAYSLSPTAVTESIEHGAPSFDKRLQALVKLQQHGWRIGIRFDPIVWNQTYESQYAKMVEDVFTQLDPKKIDSVTLGGFRLPKDFYKTMRNLYPENALFSAGLSDNNGMVTYRRDIETQIFESLINNMQKHISSDRIYSYPTHQND